MDISANRDWRIYQDHICFFYKQLARLITEFTDLGFGDETARSQERDRSTKKEQARNVSYMDLYLIFKVDLILV